MILTACVQAPPVIKIGLVGSFEGRQRDIGYDVIYSARLAVREINGQGGIAGHRVALVALDDGGDPELARQTAVSLTLDPAIVAVVGHWQPETTAVAQPIYAEAGVAFIPMGERPFGPVPPETLSPDFHQAYEAVTPFDEVPGPYAGTTYDAFQLLWEQITAVSDQPLTRSTIFNTIATP
ncbi:MAG: ABC transporter substrate-binding protein [Chloroflexota bacterium]